MEERIETLFNLCKEQPFDIRKIEDYIRENKMTSEEITRTAIKLCDYGNFSYSDYLWQYEKEPLPEDLETYNWETLFDILIENGLDADMVFCDDRNNYDNILQSVMYFDNKDLNARLARNILSRTGTPNVVIDGTPFFEETDSDFILDIEMDLYEEKWQLDNAFRFWLVLIGFGGVMKGGKLPVNMCDNYSPECFKEFEKFDYRIVYKENDYEIQIFDKETGVIVATV